MNVKHCEECLSKRGRYLLVWESETCRACGHKPVVHLSPDEIRICLGIEQRR